MARSYRRTFIETAGDLRSTFAHKVFCAWDFSTATNEAAALRSKSVYNELKVSIWPPLLPSSPPPPLTLPPPSLVFLN
jgi:hypothetical protein